jgi:zinc/manganese transport system substrate-binding protein
MAIFRKLIFSSILLFVVSLSACSDRISDQQTEHMSGEKPLPTDTKLKVLTTIAPLYCFTKNIAGDLADVENLLPSGVGPHEYSASPADVKKISEAQVLIKNGVNLELWLDKLIASAGRKELVVVDTSAGVETINNNPHIWLSPKNAIIQAKNIQGALAKADPKNSKKYMENTEKYIKRLDTLDQEIRAEVQTWKHKEFVAFHSAFSYLERDYGLRQVAVIQESPEKEPTPKHIANVINTIEAKGIKVIFSEPQASHKIVKSIAEDLNLQVYSLDTMETVSIYPVRKESPDGVYPGWYEDRMRANVEVLKKALKDEFKD